MNAVDEPLLSENEIINQESYAEKQKTDIEAQENAQMQEEQKREDVLKAQKDAGDISSEDFSNQIAQIKNQSSQEIGALQKEDSAIVDEIKVLHEEEGEVSQAEVAANTMHNQEAIQKEVQLAATIKLSDIIGNLKIFAPKLSLSYPSDQCNSMIFTCNKFSDVLSGMDRSQLTPDQITKIDQLKTQIEAVVASVHAHIFHNIDLVIDASSQLSTADALNSIVEEITNAYGLDMVLPANATSREQTFYQEGQSLLMIFNNTSSTADYAQKLLAYKQKVYDISNKMLEAIPSLSSDLQLEPVTNDDYYNADDVGDNFVGDINSGLAAGSGELNNLVDKYGQDLAGNSFGQLPKTLLSILSKVQFSLGNGDYDTTKVGLKTARDNVNVSLNYLDAAYDSLLSKKELFEALSKQRMLTSNELSNKKNIELSLDTFAKNISEVSLAKSKIDALSFITDSGIKQVLASYQKDVGLTIKSTAISIFDYLGNKLGSFFSKVKSSFVFKKADTILSDQITQIMAGVNAMQSNMVSYVDSVETLIESARKFDINTPFSDFSQDKSPTSKMNDPKYRKLNSEVITAKTLLNSLQAEVAEINYRNGMVANLGDGAWGVYQMMGVSGYIAKECPTFVVNGSIDPALITNFLKIPQSPTADQILSLGRAELRDINGNSFVYSDDQMIAAGNDVFARLKNAQKITDLSVNDMLYLAKMYEDQSNNPSNSNLNDAKSARNIYYLLKGSGSLGWEQVKSLIAGKQDYQQIAQKNNAIDYANTVGQIFNIKQVIDSMKIALMPAGANLQSVISDLQVWLESANQVLGVEPTDDNDDFVMVPSAADINADYAFFNSVGLFSSGGNSMIDDSVK